MERQDLISLGGLALAETLKLANQILPGQLSGRCFHGIYWSSHLGKLYELEEAVDRLLDNGAFPPIVDLTIRGSLESKPLCIWIPSGHPKVSNLEETWNEGFGPFKPMGLMIPSHLGGSAPLDSNRLALIGQDWLQMTEDQGSL